MKEQSCAWLGSGLGSALPKAAAGAPSASKAPLSSCSQHHSQFAFKSEYGAKQLNIFFNEKCVYCKQR